MTPELARLAPAAWVTIGYFAYWYYLLLGKQRGTKYRLKRQYEEAGKPFDRYFGQDREMLAADRVVGNNLEQMGPFLSSLWLCAIFASADIAGWLGTAYVALRIGYPMLMGPELDHVQSKRVAFVTIPCYGIILAMYILAARSLLAA